MGKYMIIIHGTGPIHNPAPNNEGDADRLAAEFVKRLKDNGHTVRSAEVTEQCAQDLLADN